MRNYTLGFHIYTTNFIGELEDLRYILKGINTVPSKYMPTKYDINNQKGIFSSTNIDEILEKATQRSYYSVNMNVYKIKRIFELLVLFKRKPLPDCVGQPNRMFHSISIYINNGLECISNENEFKILRELWINYCETFEAVYGQCHLFDPFQNSNSYLGWGHGICISRLHWQNYFGKPFNNVFDYNKDSIMDKCEIEKCQSGATILTLKENPKNITLRTDLEREVINSLGAEYFWNESDNRLKPKFNYKLTNHITEVMYDPIEVNES